MSPDDQLRGIIRSRKAAGRTLLAAISSQKESYSEIQLAKSWILAISQESTIIPYGWYQPPPMGMTVLIGNPSQYTRLDYSSLRYSENFPGDHIFSTESVLYPYFSAVDKSTLMIGDHVGSYYRGHNKEIREWISYVYRSTKKIARSVEIGMKYSDLFGICNSILFETGAKNNNYSMQSGLASDIGHSIPFFGESSYSMDWMDRSPAEVSKTISTARKFVGPSNNDIIESPCAFTIEPQFIVNGLPMVSFHMIVVVIDNDIKIIEEFEDLFAHFKMNDWI